MGIVQGKCLISVIDFQDPVGAGAYVEHEHVVHAKQELPEARVAAAVLKRKWVVDGYVSAI